MKKTAKATKTAAKTAAKKPAKAVVAKKTVKAPVAKKATKAPAKKAACSKGKCNDKTCKCDEGKKCKCDNDCKCDEGKECKCENGKCECGNFCFEDLIKEIFGQLSDESVIAALMQDYFYTELLKRGFEENMANTLANKVIVEISAFEANIEIKE